MLPTATRLVAPDRRGSALLVLGAGAAAVVLSVGVVKMGAALVVLPLALVMGVVLVQFPAQSLALAFVTVTVFEDDEYSVVGFTAPWFRYLLGLPITPSELLVAVALAGLVVELVRRRGFSRIELRVPIVALFASSVLLAAVLGGATTAWYRNRDLVRSIDNLHNVALLVVVPLVVCVAVDHLDLIESGRRIFTWVVAGKATIGVLGWMMHIGRPLTVDEGTRMTYYSPTVNQLCLTYIVYVAAVALRSGWRSVNRLMAYTAGAAFVSLLLSFRRSFWIATVLGLLMVLVVATGRRGRPWLLLLGASLVFAVALTFNVGGTTTGGTTSDSQNVIVARARVNDNEDDRYRIDERRNVFEEIKRHPVTGIGPGFEWKARFPLAEALESGREYTHVAALWFWLKLGLFGLVGYGSFVAAVCITGWQVWRWEQGTSGAAGLAIAVAEVGRAIAETTGTFTGANGRFTLGEAIVAGWLFAAWVQAYRRRLDRGLARTGAAGGERVLVIT